MSKVSEDARGAIPKGMLAGLKNPSIEQDDLTSEYLEAGMRLIASNLNAAPATKRGHPFLRWLSRSAVIAEVRNGRAGLRGGDGSFRYRWSTHANYVRDLITYVRWRRTESVLPTRSPDLVHKALAEASPSAGIRAITQLNLDGLFSNSLFRLQLVALAVVGSSLDSETAPSFYSEAAQRWSSLIQEFLDTHGLKLRDDSPLEDVVEILIAVGDGLAMRELADPTEGSARDRRLGLQAVAALSLLVALANDGEDRTLDQRADDLGD